MPLRSFTPAELILTERRRLERPLLVMIWLGVAAFSLAGGNMFYLLAGTGVVAVNMLAVHRAKEVYLRRLFVNAAVILATAVPVLEVAATDTHLLTALGHYMILIQLCKLFERKTNRDYVQMLILSGLLMVAAAMTSNSLWFGAALVLYLALACHTTMVFTLKRGLDNAAGARLAGESGPLAPRRVAWNVARDWPAVAVAKKLGVIMFAILAAGVLLFLVAPRSRPAAGSILPQGSSAVSGFTGSVRLGGTKKVYLSDKIVMRLHLRSRPADRTSFYLRGRTFEQYNCSRWSNRHDIKAGTHEETFLPEAPQDMLAGAVVQEITMDPSLLPTLFASYPAMRVRTFAGQPRIAKDGNWSIRQCPSRQGPIRYTAHSLPQPLTAAQRGYIMSMRLRVGRPMTAPAENVETTPRVVELARRWCRDLLDERAGQPQRRDELDLAIARRLASRLEDEYPYSLDLAQADPGRDGVEDFLFHMKQGHCEYFASALAVMCNSLSVRARLATGFRTDAAAAAKAPHPVRERDAHAWVEVFTPSTDWIVVDPSPRRSPAASRSWWAGFRNFWDNLKFLWYEKIIGYDAEGRGRFLKRVWDLAAGATRAVAGLARNIYAGFLNLLIHGYVDKALVRFAIILGLAGLALEAMLVRRLLRRGIRARREFLRTFSVPRKDLEFMRKLFALLERGGLRRSDYQTPMELARQGAAQLSLPASVLAELVETYYRLRWGHMSPGPEELLAAEHRVDKLNEMLTATAR